MSPPAMSHLKMSHSNMSHSNMSHSNMSHPNVSDPNVSDPTMSDTITEPTAYLRDGAAIYRRSFAIIRAEADLSRFTPDQGEIAVRMIHAGGQVDMAEHIVFGGDLVGAARAALAAAAPILCDSEMIAHGITRARLPAGNAVICTLNDPRTAAI